MTESLIELFGLSVTPYALCVFLAAVVCVALFFLRAKKRGLAAKTAEYFILFSLPLGILSAHLLYFLTSLPEMLEASADYGALYLLSPVSGGFLFYGVLIGAALSALVASAITKEKAARILDAAAPVLLLLVALYRFSEPLDAMSGMGQGWGMLVENERFMFFPLAFKPNAEYDEWYFSIFLLEGVYALLMSVLTWANNKKRGDGQIALLSLIVYCAAQVLFETLRRDTVVKWLFVRVSQLLSVIILAALLTYGTIKYRKAGVKFFWSWLSFVLLTGLCVGIEFTVDKPIPLGDQLIFLPYAVTYAIIGISAALMGVIAWRAVRKRA